MWSFNDSSEETLLADCLALSVFSLNTALHQTQVVYSQTRVLYSTRLARGGLCVRALREQSETQKSLFMFKFSRGAGNTALCLTCSCTTAFRCIFILLLCFEVVGMVD